VPIFTETFTFSDCSSSTTSSFISISPSTVDSSPISASTGTSAASPASTAASCDNQGIEYALYSLPKDISNVKRDSVLGGSNGNGGLNSGGGLGVQSGLVGSVVNVLPTSTLSAVLSNTLQTATGVVGSAVSAVSSVPDAVTSVAGTAVSVVTGVVSSAGPAVTSDAGAAGSIVPAVVSDASGLVSTITTSADSALNGALQTASADASLLSGAVTSVAGNLDNTVTSVLSDAVPSVTAIVGSPVSVAASVISSAASAAATELGNFDSSLLQTLSPIQTGTSSGAGGFSSDDSSPLSTIYNKLAGQNLAQDLTALVQRAYFVAPQSGEYTFTLSNVNNDADQALLWLGDNAFSGYNNGNADCQASLATTGSCQVVADLTQGDYLPYRILYQHGTGPEGFNFEIADAQGNDVVDSSSLVPSSIVRSSCDGTSAPAFGPFGDE